MLAAQAATILIVQLAAWVVRLTAGVDVANLLASWLVIPRIAGGLGRADRAPDLASVTAAGA